MKNPNSKKKYKNVVPKIKKSCYCPSGAQSANAFTLTPGRLRTTLNARNAGISLAKCANCRFQITKEQNC